MEAIFVLSAITTPCVVFLVSHTIRKEVAQRESHDMIYGSINHVWLGYRDSQRRRNLFSSAG